MKKRNPHLNLHQRIKIKEILSIEDFQESRIERIRSAGIHPSTFYREIKRNSVEKGYDPLIAHKKYEERKKKQASQIRTFTQEIKDQVIENLVQYQWSPEQISGRLKLEGLASISHETIYKYLIQDKMAGGDLYTHLRRRGKKYNKRLNKQAGRGFIPGRVDISERPKIVEEKKRIGDWELDTILGKDHKGAIVSAVDRASKYTRLWLVPNKTSSAVTDALLKCLSPYKSKVKTLTADNGKEFAKHAVVAKSLNAGVYFATPYHSWERGLNEHTNGLVRQYLPKKTNFLGVTSDQVSAIENRLNNRPRKSLNYRTPREMFDET